MNGFLDPPAPEPLTVSPRCVVVVRPDGVAVQQDAYAPPWPLEPAHLELLAAIDVAGTADITAIKREVAVRAGIDEAGLNDFVFRLRLAGNVTTEPRAEHPPAPVRPDRAPLTPVALDSGDVTMHTPFTLRLVDGMFELLDHDGYRCARFTPAEVAAIGVLGRRTTAAAAYEAHRAAAGPLAVDEERFAEVLGELERAQLLRRTPAAPGDATPAAAPDRAQVITEVFDRHAARQTAAEREREQATGVHRTKVVPVAFDMGTPAALGMIIAHAKAHDGGRLEDRYDFRTDWVWSNDRLEEFTAEPAIYLFSNYLWSHHRCLQVSALIKELSPDSITIHGGPDTPKYEQDMYRYFEENPHVDIGVRGEGEMTATHLLDVLQDVIGTPDPDLSVLRDVAGIGYRDRAGVHRTEDRERITDLDVLPSPFLTGLFDVFADVPDVFVTLETNRGCPYGCTFCDWGSATASRIRKFDLDRVFAEIDWCAGIGVDSISVADANFGILARDIEIAQRVADDHRRRGTPKAFGVAYAKNTVKHVRAIIAILAEAGVMTQGVLSLQTMDPDTLKVIHRSNIKTEQYDQLADEMRLAHLPLMVELMMGLPGMTVESFADDLQQCIDRNVPARINITTLLVNSPMNEPSYLEEHQIETEVPLRPGTNAVVVSTTTFDRDDHAAMHDLRTDFMLFENWSVLRHVAPFVRRETGRREIDLYRLIRRRTSEEPHRWPALHALVTHGSDLMAPPHSWALVMAELRRFLVVEAGVTDGTALGAAIATQHALLPSHGRTFPCLVVLDHDVVGWFEQVVAAKASGHLHDWETVVPRLGDLGPGELTIDDPDDIIGTSIGVSFDMNVVGFNWEFDSPLSRASVAAQQFADWVSDSLLSAKFNETDAGSVPVTMSRRS